MCALDAVRRALEIRALDALLRCLRAALRVLGRVLQALHAVLKTVGAVLKDLIGQRAELALLILSAEMKSGAVIFCSR